MALGYFPAVTVLLLLETATVTGGATTKSTTSTTATPPEPRPFASVSDTTSGTETTTPAAETNGYLSSSVALVSKTTSPWSIVGETSLTGVATTVPSSSLPEGSTPAVTQGVSPTSSSLEVSSIFTTAFGTTHPAESTMVVISSTTQQMTSSPHSPTPRDKRMTEGPLTIIAITTQEESTSETRLSSPPFTTETTKTSSLSVPLPTPTVATSTLLRASSGVGDITGSSSQVTTSSEAEITSWWPGISPSSTSSSVTQDKSTPKATSTSPLSSNSGRTSLGLSAPSPSTNPTSESPSTPFKVLSSTPTSPSASTSLPETPGGATTKPITTTSQTPPEPRPFASVADTTSGTETTTPAAETNGYLPSSVAFLSKTTSPWSIVGETNLPGVATTAPSSSSPEGSTPAGTQGVSPTSSSLKMSSIFTTAFGTTHPVESTMVVISSTTQQMTSSPHSPTPWDKRTPEGPSTIIAITTQEKSINEKCLSSPPFTTETMKTSPLSVPLPTPIVATSTLLSASSGVGDTTSSSQVTTNSEAEITSWWRRISPSSNSSSVTQDKSTPKATSTGLLSSNSRRTSLRLSAPSSSTNPTSQYPATPFKVLPSTPTSPSASTSLPKTPARTRFILSVRFSTQLNITDPSISHAVQKWLNDELQAKFPVGSFSLNWIG